MEELRCVGGGEERDAGHGVVAGGGETGCPLILK